MGKFSNIDDYVTDPKIEIEGVDLAFGKDRFITVKRAGGANVAFTNYIAMKFEQHKNEVSRNVFTDEKAREIMQEAYARFVAIDWRGWKDGEGHEVPFTVQDCIELFNESREIYEAVVTQCNNLNNFRAVQVKESGNE